MTGTCSGHTALFEDSTNIVEIMFAYGFPHPAHSSFSSPLYSSNGAPPSPVPKREEAVPDEVMDEMGLILEPWRVKSLILITCLVILLCSMLSRRLTMQSIYKGGQLYICEAL